MRSSATKHVRRTVLAAAIGVSLILATAVAYASDSGSADPFAPASPSPTAAGGDLAVASPAASPLTTAAAAAVVTESQATTSAAAVVATPSPTTPAAFGTYYDAPAPANDGGAALRAFIARVPNGSASSPSIVRLAPGASYASSVQITLTDREHVWIDGRGASVTSTSRSSNRNVFSFD